MLFRNLDKWAEQNNTMPEHQPTQSQTGRTLVKKQAESILKKNEPPMMYRAQVQGRCNLQFAGDNSNLEKWKEEWTLPQRDRKPSHQYEYKSLDSDHPNNLIHSIKIKFSYRVLSNSGQDSILRPVLSVHGIPFIPGSSVKGIFRRLAKSKSNDSPDKNTIETYCGTEENPGILRFHGAYPIGDWTNCMVDIVHPQQSRQVKNNNLTSAFTLISFYQPQFVFEFSNVESHIIWEDVDRILHEALAFGLGGKTSTGYGFLSIPNYADCQHSEQYNQAFHVSFKGIGVCSTLLNRRQPEFRPNMFKAALRGHIMRLLGGVCNLEPIVEKHVNRLLGSTDQEGVIKLFWESKELDDTTSFTNIYTKNGTLHITADSRANKGDIDFVGKVLQFAYVMGGFGKSWRRVWHQQFMPDYKRFPIGCHWELKSDWINYQKTIEVNSKDTLSAFLKDLHAICLNRLCSHPPAPIFNWREAWHPNRVAVYTSNKLVTKSQAIQLFHREPFKTTPAIGGRERLGEPKFVSYVWHRMLPVGDKYLENVTVFHGDRTPHSPWRHRTQGNQLKPFIESLENAQLKLTWGTPPVFNT
ncbi:RAMP superfamily CRISPR-associated protein [Nostoc sp.]|uniref:RAMP superfamily CRISPR-associated protein n=1 Tax=Nostoc sp. TaxID=1180 RepID=UPI002FFB0278